MEWHRIWKPFARSCHGQQYRCLREYGQEIVGQGQPAFCFDGRLESLWKNGEYSCFFCERSLDSIGGAPLPSFSRGSLWIFICHCYWEGGENGIYVQIIYIVYFYLHSHLVGAQWDVQASSKMDANAVRVPQQIALTLRDLWGRDWGDHLTIQNSLIWVCVELEWGLILYICIYLYIYIS